LALLSCLNIEKSLAQTKTILRVFGENIARFGCLKDSGKD